MAAKTRSRQWGACHMIEGLHAIRVHPTDKVNDLCLFNYKNMNLSSSV